MSRGAAESKTAMTELINELDRTRKEYAKSAMQVTQLDTQLHSARDELIVKDQRVQALEVDMKARDERHRQQVSTMEEEYKSKETAWLHRIKGLEIEVSRLQNENAAMIQLERENRQLRDTILENQAVTERLQAINDDLRNKSKEESKDQSSFLEAEFKKRLAESEKKFRAEAYRALSEEAKLALQGNDHLQTVLQRQNDSIEAVLLRCKTLEQAHAKIQDEHDVNLQSMQSHVAEIQRLKRSLAEAKSKGVLMDEALKQRRVERASLELLFVEYETTRKQLASVKEKCRRALREADRWKSRAVQLTRELDDEQREAAESKLATMQAQSDNIEAHLERKRQRDIRRAQVRESHADGANALRLAEAGGSDPWSEGGSDAAAWEGLSDDEEEGKNSLRHRTIDPMEILAMWNVNFESWKAPPEEGHPTVSGSPVQSPTKAKSPTYPMEAISDVPEARGAAMHASSAGTTSASPAQATRLSELVTSVPVTQQMFSAAVGHSQQQPLPPKQPAMSVSERQQALDAKLSVLSHPKAPIPYNARHYIKGGRRPLDLQQRASMPPLQELNTVSRGEFKVASRSGSGSSDRFLVP